MNAKRGAAWVLLGLVVGGVGIASSEAFRRYRATATRAVPATRDDLLRWRQFTREVEDLQSKVDGARASLIQRMAAEHGIDPASSLDLVRGVWIAPVTSAQ